MKSSATLCSSSGHVRAAGWRLQVCGQRDGVWNPAVFQSTLEALRSMGVRGRRQMSPRKNRSWSQTDRAWNPAVLQSTLEAPRSMGVRAALCA